MKINEVIITEGIKLKSPQELYAYACVVAEAYDKAPEQDAEAVKSFRVLYQSVQKLLKRMKSDVNVRYKQDDPYNSPEEIGQDIVKNKQLDIYSGDSEHPVLSPDQNVELRAVHDYFAHIGPNRKSIGKEFKTHNFTLRGEYNAYLTHVNIAPRAAIPALFTEIIGQVSSYHILQKFREQKAAILHGFDYVNIGVMDERNTNRYELFLDALHSKNTRRFKVNVSGGVIINKDNIKWSEISQSGKKL